MAEHELVHVEPPEFQDRIAEVEAEMAQQFANLREMERNGELEPIPEVQRRFNNKRGQRRQWRTRIDSSRVSGCRAANSPLQLR